MTPGSDERIVERWANSRGRAEMPDLSMTELMAVGITNAVATAVLVTCGAGLIVKMYESRQEARKITLQAGISADQRKLTEEHDARQKAIDQEFQTRSTLRDSYASLLVVQRASREASRRLASSSGEERARALKSAKSAHTSFIDQYHRLALDADEPMWLDMRSLRHILDDMLKYANLGNVANCERLAELAKHARQNLEQSFRTRLGHKPLQDRKDVGGYFKTRQQVARDELEQAVREPDSLAGLR